MSQATINYYSIIISILSLLISVGLDIMANSKDIFKDFLRLLFLCLTIDLIVQLNVAARQLSHSYSDDDILSNYIPLARSKSKSFQPIPIKLPDTIRAGADAEMYKEYLLATMNPRARKEDKNLKMTGESCARGLGHLYKV